MERISGAVPTMRLPLVFVAAIAYIIVFAGGVYAAGGPVVGQILDYEKGYIVLTNGFSYELGSQVRDRKSVV